jgi:hypothetical protein
LTNKFDLSKLSDEELLELDTNVRDYIHNKRIPEPDFNLHKSIQIEDSSTVNPNTLIPTLEFKISVNKEDLQDFRVLWEDYYNKQKQFYKYHQVLPPEKQVTVDIKNAIQIAFMNHLDKVFPSIHYT